MIMLQHIITIYLHYNKYYLCTLVNFFQMNLFSIYIYYLCVYSAVFYICFTMFGFCVCVSFPLLLALLMNCQVKHKGNISLLNLILLLFLSCTNALRLRSFIYYYRPDFVFCNM